ncbi:MAG: hypothetical protein WBA99_18860 [Nodosilinea sp.]
MIYQIPPATLPAEVFTMALIEAVAVSAECKKHSRDCFPGDLVGVAPENVTVLSIHSAVPIAGAGVLPVNQHSGLAQQESV